MDDSSEVTSFKQAAVGKQSEFQLSFSLVTHKSILVNKWLLDNIKNKKIYIMKDKRFREEV